MSMVTSCPACTTTFRITPEQLKKREGKVRCGKCSGVFDAFKSLASLPDQTVAADENTTVAPPATYTRQSGPHGRTSDAGERLAVQGTLDIAAASGLDDAATAQRRAARARKRRIVWSCVIVVLAIFLGLQIAYALRDQIAGAWPAARPALERLCQPLGCTVSFPRRTEQLAIESSDLQTDPQRPNVVIVTAALRNRGNSLVAHPSLELTLTNAQDQVLARRVFQPADYLADPSAVERGMAGLAEINVRIALDTGDLKPAGYRLFLFYP